MKKYALILATLAFVTNAFGYSRITLSSGGTPKWPSMPVSYWINATGLPSIGNGSEFSAVQAAFQTWQNVPSADVRFNYMGTTPVGSIGFDGMNVITFSDPATPLGSSVIAATFSFFNTQTNVIAEADVLFNPSKTFSTSAESGNFDIQSVLTHEIGHLLGLDHSAMVSSVMTPFGAPSQLDQRMLAYDDVAGITEIYPNASALPPTGQIRGTIQSATGPVFGAHVVAVSSDGTPMVSTLSQKDGSYLVRFLPPGPYRVYAEPLDLPVAAANVSSFYSTGQTNFGMTYFGNAAALELASTVDVTAGGVATADIQTLPKSSTNLNLTGPGFGFRVVRGFRYRVTLGGVDLTSGVSFTASNPNITLGPATFGGPLSSATPTSASMDLTIFPSTPLGPKNIAVLRGADASVTTGALVITDAPPLNVTISPENGAADGGTPVTVSGSNFRPGAQVYFGGIAGTNVTVINSGTILVNAPKNSPAAKNVVVVNADGTWAAAAQPFFYDALPPAPPPGGGFTPVEVKIAPFALQNSSQFTGIGLLASTSMNILLTAYTTSGAMLSGPGIVNPVTIALTAGQQEIRLAAELFGAPAIDGWIEADASAAGLGVFTAVGTWDLAALDSANAAELAQDFVLFHAAGTAFIVNPSTTAAAVTITSLKTNAVQSLSIGPKARIAIALDGPTHVQSSQALAAVEMSGGLGRLALNEPAAVSDAQATLVFTQAVNGGGYASTLTLVNAGSAAQSATITFDGASTTVQVSPNASVQLPISDFAPAAPGQIRAGALTVSGTALFSQSALLGVLDIQNPTSLVTLGARPAATDFLLPFVANGSGLFTGLAFVAGANPAILTVDVYDKSGAKLKSGLAGVGANQQSARLLSDIVGTLPEQSGGYIRVHSDQPVWAWELYGSDQVMASAPPQ